MQAISRRDARTCGDVESSPSFITCKAVRLRDNLERGGHVAGPERCLPIVVGVRLPAKQIRLVAG